VLEGTAAAERSGGGVLCVEDVQPEDAAIGEGADKAVAAPFAVAAAATGRAGIGKGLAASGDDLIAGLRSHAHGLRSWVTEVRCRFPRT
jgi:hypothetical protein